MKKLQLMLLMLVMILGITSCGPNEQEQLNLDALAHYEAGDYSTAIQAFTDAIERYPEYSDYYAYRGMAYFENAQYELAQGDMDKAIELDP